MIDLSSGALGEMVAAVATRSQLKTPSGMPDILRDPVLVQDEFTTRHKGPTDNIGQSRLPFTFGLADVATKQPHDRISNEENTSMMEDMVKELAGKVLEVLLFSGIQLQCPDFDAAIAYHMAGKMM